MLLLLKLRTPACVIVGALCVLVSFVEPLRLIPWDMVIAAVTGAACIALFMSERPASVEPAEPEEEMDDHDYYDVPSRIATAEERGAQDALLRRYEQRAAERPGKLGDADRAAAAYIRRNRATLPEHSAVDDYDDCEEGELQ